MLNSRPQTQSSLEFVCIDELVPKDHLLRKIDKQIDVSFIHDLVKDLYCPDNSRPSLDPTLMLKLLLLGYLFVFEVNDSLYVKRKLMLPTAGSSV